MVKKLGKKGNLAGETELITAEGEKSFPRNLRTKGRANRVRTALLALTEFPEEVITLVNEYVKVVPIEQILTAGLKYLKYSKKEVTIPAADTLNWTTLYVITYFPSAQKLFDPRDYEQGYLQLPLYTVGWDKFLECERCGKDGCFVLNRRYKYLNQAKGACNEEVARNFFSNRASDWGQQNEQIGFIGFGRNGNALYVNFPGYPKNNITESGRLVDLRSMVKAQALPKDFWSHGLEE